MMASEAAGNNSRSRRRRGGTAPRIQTKQSRRPAAAYLECYTARETFETRRSLTGQVRARGPFRGAKIKPVVSGESMDALHLLSRLRLRTMRKVNVSWFLVQEMAGAVIVPLLLYVWLPFLRPVVKPKITFSRFGIQTTFWPKTYYDLEVWRDVFEDGDCDIEVHAPPNVILDLGAHVGLTTMYYAMKYPDARIISIEAEPSNYRQLVINTRQFRNVETCNYAVCGEDRPVELFVHPRSVSHSLVERSEGGTSTIVAGRSLDSLWAEHRISRVDLIKFNIEGMEFEVFAGFSHKTDVGAYLGYFHFDLADENADDVFDMFKEYVVTQKPSKPMRTKIYAVKRAA
jgi:FkbM family methyltransferase